MAAMRMVMGILVVVAHLPRKSAHIDIAFDARREGEALKQT
jgi:hypothetical protein